MENRNFYRFVGLGSKRIDGSTLYAGHFTVHDMIVTAQGMCMGLRGFIKKPQIGVYLEADGESTLVWVQD